MKTPTLKSLKKKAWDLQSKYIRQKAGGMCFTCGDKRNWKEQQAGHFLHGDCMDFDVITKGDEIIVIDPINIQCQCSRCNFFLHGNSGIYGVKMVKIYGDDVVDELILRHHQVRKWTRDELEAVIKRYSEDYDIRRYGR